MIMNSFEQLVTILIDGQSFSVRLNEQKGNVKCLKLIQTTTKQNKTNQTKPEASPRLIGPWTARVTQSAAHQTARERETKR